MNFDSYIHNEEKLLENVKGETYTRLFMAVLFVRAKTQKQPKWSRENR